MSLTATLCNLCRIWKLTCLVTLTVNTAGLAMKVLPKLWQMLASSPFRCAMPLLGSMSASLPQELQVHWTQFSLLFSCCAKCTSGYPQTAMNIITLMSALLHHPPVLAYQ